MAKVKIDWGPSGRMQTGESADKRFWTSIERVRTGKRPGEERRFTEYFVQVRDRQTGAQKSKTVYAKPKAEAKQLIEALQPDLGNTTHASVTGRIEPGCGKKAPRKLKNSLLK